MSVVLCLPAHLRVSTAASRGRPPTGTRHYSKQQEKQKHSAENTRNFSLDTGATISIVAKKVLPCGSLKNTMTTAAIRMGDGHVVHSCGDCEVEVPMGSRTIAHRFYVMDTEAFDFVLGTDFFVQHSQIQSLTLQAPYLLYVDHGSGRESVPLEQSEHTSSYLRLSKEEPSNMMADSKTEDYQLFVWCQTTPQKPPPMSSTTHPLPPPLQVTNCTLFSTTSPHAKFPET